MPSQTIDIGGMILTRSVREYMSVLQERLQTGIKIRIMICDPNNIEVINQIALRVEGNFSSDYWKDRLDSTAMYVREIAKTPHKRGAIKLGFLPFVPAFGQISIDAQRADSKCYVEIYHHKSPDFGAVFELQKVNDAFWHRFFVQQYELLWASCKTEML